ncbi:hypothetical protein ABT367_24295, partial [Streptomyces mesophilus]
MADDGEPRAEAPSFLSCAREVVRLLGLEESSALAQSRWGSAASAPEPRRARALAAAVREPLLERPTLPEEFFAPLMAASVHDPDPSFCRWFVEPAVYSFGRRRVCAALLAYLPTASAAPARPCARGRPSARQPGCPPQGGRRGARPADPGVGAP